MPLRVVLALAAVLGAATATHVSFPDATCAVFPERLGLELPFTASTLEARVRLLNYLPTGTRSIVGAAPPPDNSTLLQLGTPLSLRLVDDSEVPGLVNVAAFNRGIASNIVAEVPRGEAVHITVTMEKLPPASMSFVFYINGVALTRDLVDYADTLEMDGIPGERFNNVPWSYTVGCFPVTSALGTSSNSFPLNGEVDQVRVWDAIRTPAQIREAAAATYGPGELRDSALILAFHADSSGIMTAYDGAGDLVMVGVPDGVAEVVEEPLVVAGLDPQPAVHSLPPYEAPEQDASTFPWTFETARGFQETVPFGDHGFLFFGGCLIQNAGDPAGGPYFYDYATGTMELLETTGTPPEPRCSVSMNIIGRKLVIAGGLLDLFDISLLFRDTIDVLDLDTMEWSQPWTLPRPRALHQGFEVDGRIMMVLGGSGLFVGEPEIFVLDTTDGSFEILTPTGENPEKIATATAISGRTIYSFGGVENLVMFPATDTLYQLDIDTLVWTALATLPIRPSYASMIVHGSRLLIWGGVDSDIDDFSELLSNVAINIPDAFEYDLKTGVVEQLEDPDFFLASVSSAIHVVGSQLVMTYELIEDGILVRTTQLDECPATCTLNRGVCHQGLCICHPPYFDDGDYSCSLQPCVDECVGGYCDTTEGVCVFDGEDPEADFVQVAVVAGTLTGVCGGIYFVLNRANSEANNFVVITVILSLADMVTDILFTSSIWNRSEFKLEAALAATFLIVPLVFDVVVVVRFISRRFKIDGRKFFVENEAIIASVCLLASTNVAALNLLCSKIAHKPAFSLEWDRQLRHRIRMIGLVRMLAEDLPHLTLQIIVAMQLDNVSTLLYLSFFFTGLGLLMSFVRLGMFFVLQMRSRANNTLRLTTTSQLDVVESSAPGPASLAFSGKLKPSRKELESRVTELEAQVSDLKRQLAEEQEKNASLQGDLRRATADETPILDVGDQDE